MKSKLFLFICFQKGYSFVAEARTEEQALGSGLWRMRLIGSLSALPATQTGDVCCNFVTKQIIDYYVPNSKNIVFRFVDCKAFSLWFYNIITYTKLVY